jgi:CDP-6-deoxy-D-xylo-4-hexulose-3-dehydrase
MTTADRSELVEIWRRRGPRHSPFVPGISYIPASGKVLDDEDGANLLQACLDGWLTAGRFAVDLEERLAGATGTNWALLTTSGSSANLLATAALFQDDMGERRLRPGDEVITVAAGFPTTVAPIVQNGGIPVFIDVDLATANLDVTLLEDAMSPRTRAISVAHTLGNPFELDKVMEFAEQNDLLLIEDCCDALGATQAGRQVGTGGTFATLSFYPAHHMTMGEGGAVMGNHPQHRRVVLSLRDWGRDCWCEPGKDNTCSRRYDWQLGELPHGYDHKYVYSRLGYNLKVTDLQAAVGLSQLDKVPRFIEARRRNHESLRAGFERQGWDDLFLIQEPTRDSDPSWFGFLITIRPGVPLVRRDLVQALEAHRIGTRLLFGGNLIRQPALRGVEYRVGSDLSRTDYITDNSFWIGVWPGLTDEHLAYMLEIFGGILREVLK